MKTVIFVTNIPAHYRIALIKLVAKRLIQHNINMTTIFSRMSYKKRDYWNIGEKDLTFNYKIVKGKNSFLIKDKLLEFGFSTIKEVKNIKPNLLVFVGFSIQSFLLTKYCIANRIPYYVYSGETVHTAAKYKFNIIRKIQRSYIIKNADGFLVYGNKADEYIRGFNRKSNNINIVINSIDTNSFVSKLNKISVRPNKLCKILFIGDLIKRKGVKHLIDAFSSLDDITKKKCSLVIGGGGANIDDYKNYVTEKNILNIFFTGKLSHEETLNYYKQCDLFVLPSTYEHYGLVLVEAACAGKPLIGSKYAGGSYELIKENKNGFIIDPENTIDFSSKLKVLINDESLRIEFGKNSLKIVEESVNIEIAAESFANSIIKQFNV